MLMDGRTDGWTHGRKVITIAHPEHSSGELISAKKKAKLRVNMFSSISRFIVYDQSVLQNR